jgi:chemotaxis protein methyltransferase CheR
VSVPGELSPSHARPPLPPAKKAGRAMEAITERELTELVQYIKQNYGINLTHKKSLVSGRLYNFILQSGFRGFSDYFRHVYTDKTGKAGITLVNKLTTNHTYFMREPKHFEFMKQTILPYLIKKEAKNKDLRIWSAGCSTGEEPYTLAMLMGDFFGSEKWLWDTKILATDISTAVLEQAKRAIYLDAQLELLPVPWRRQYFHKVDDENMALVENIKQEVIFRRFNLMNEIFPFKKKFHVIFCRNVMIYFDADTRRELIERFYQHTEPGGYLLIGYSESINRFESKYKFIEPAIYRKG